MPWVQPGLCCGCDEEPRSRGEPSAGRPAGGRSGPRGSPLEGTSLQEWMHPGEPIVVRGCINVGCHFCIFNLSKGVFNVYKAQTFYRQLKPFFI